MTGIVFLYVTAPNAETAARIGRTLIEEKLAACVNIHGEMRSIYEWEGSVELHLETPVFVKTTETTADRTRDRIFELHPHETPCVVALPVSARGSSGDYLRWVAAATTA
jgi:periplasmic divalent cation tolerance protein